MSRPQPQNNRMDFLRSDNSTRSYPPSDGWNTVQRRRPDRYQKNHYNSRHNPRHDSMRDVPVELPTHSSSRDVSGPPQPKNNRLAFLDTKQEETNKKKTFVAMPSEKQWEQGFRPAWILEGGRDPPEKYIEAVKIYKNYLKTGEIVIPRSVHRNDPVKSATASYNHQNKAKKVKK
mgnify:CR=1 FL=1